MLILLVAGLLSGRPSILRPKVPGWAKLAVAAAGELSDLLQPGWDWEGGGGGWRGDGRVGGLDPLHTGASKHGALAGLGTVSQWSQSPPTSTWPAALFPTRTGDQLCHVLLISGIITISNIVIWPTPTSYTNYSCPYNYAFYPKSNEIDYIFILLHDITLYM